MYEPFLKHANDLENKNLLKTEKLYVENRDKWFSSFADHFAAICKKIINLQKDNILSGLSWIEYTLLYTDLINRRYVVEVWVYDDEKYLDKKQMLVGEYEVSFLFVAFDELWNELLAAMKTYPGKVKSHEITAFMFERLPYFHSYFYSMMRFAIQDCLEEKPFTDIVINDVFILSSSEYMARSEYIFRIDKNKNAKDLSSWFSETIKFEYTYGDYSDLDFSNQIFLNTDFRYAIFRNSNFANTSLKMSSLIGASFRGANMENCVLRKTYLYEADFTNACLKGTNFNNAEAYAGMRDYVTWDFVGYMPVSFRNADLTNTKFRHVVLKGADFRGATIENVDFTGAVLDGSIFSTRNLPLTPEQIATVIIEEGP